MRCPKCRYISFDNTDRCRNCGYEFALSTDAPPLDLPMHTADEPFGPLGDFAIEDLPGDGPSPSIAPRRDKADAQDGTAEPAARARPITSAFDLPLFKDRPIDDDTPLVTSPAVPRQPLSVRKSSPPAPRSPRSLAEDPVLNLDALEPDAPPLRHVPWLPKTDLRPRAQVEAPPDASLAQPAGLGARLAAGIADAGILAGICGAVVYITLRVCGLRLDQVGALPMAPLAGFLLLLVAGYFVLLTAADGQTIGKMATGIRVVPMSHHERVSLGESSMRAAGYLVSLLPAGLGLLPALLHADRRALHDRLADTRVVAVPRPKM